MVDTGFPNLASELTQHASTMAEIFRDNGYHTMMVGKWHLTKDSECNDGGPKHTWPCQRGFDSFYGILDPFTNFHHPHRLVRDNTAVPVDRYPDGTLQRTRFRRKGLCRSAQQETGQKGIVPVTSELQII